MKRRWKLNNKGMTLLEVIVAFAIFATAATILMVGFNGALKVMGNSNEIKEKSQSASSKIELDNGTFENGSIKFTPKNGTATTLIGKFQTATETKRDGLDITKKIFVTGDLEVAPVPSAPEEKKKKVTIAPPVPPDGNAYFQVEADPRSNFLDQTGAFSSAGFFPPNAHQIARINDTIYFTGQKKESQPNDNAQELFFMGRVGEKGANKDEFISFKEQNVKKGFALRLLYFGNDDTTSKENLFYMTAPKVNGQVDVANADSFMVYTAYGNKQTILFLPKPLKIIVKSQFSDNNIADTVTLNAGFYSLNNGTDILKAGYDKAEQDKYFKSYPDGYYRPDITLDELKQLGITTGVEQEN